MQQVNNSNNITIASFVINNVYTNKEIVEAFKCSPQGGMRRSNKTNTLVLFCLHNKELYDDKWINGILHYTGMGQQGNQSFDFAQNKTLRDSKTNGVEVHLFESYKDKEYIYDGIVELVDAPYFDNELDINGNIRKVCKFPLKRISNAPLVVSVQVIKANNAQKQQKLGKLDNKTVKELAKRQASNNPNKTLATTMVYDRNPSIVEHTKRRANGVCDLCGNNAPFIDKQKQPYLECHHLIRLADGGPDAIYNTVALCPNCHRRIHSLNDKKDINKLKKKIENYLKNDNDIDSLKEFYKL